MIRMAHEQEEMLMGRGSIFVNSILVLYVE